MTTALAVGGGAIAGAGAAQATTGSFHLYSQIKKTTLQSASYDTGTVNVTMTVTPASATPGTALTIAVSSSNMFMKNGPASNAATGAEEADAVVNFNGTDYVLRGSQNGQNVTYDDSELGGTNAPNHLFDPGWVISSAPGASSSTSTNTQADSNPTTPTTVGTVAGTTGIGATIRGAEATPVSIVAPAVGTYPLTLKAIVVNAIAGTSFPALTDDFDNVYNTVNCAASCAANGNYAKFNTNTASSYIDPFSPAVSFTSAGPAFTIDKVTTSNNTVDIPGSSSAATASAGGLLGAPAPREGDYLTVSGNSNWTASSPVFGVVCVGTGHATCAPAGTESVLWAGTTGGYSLAGGFGSWATDGSGNLPTFQFKAASFGGYTGSNSLAIYQTTTRPAPPGYAPPNSNGPNSAGVTAVADKPLYLLAAARTLSVSPASVQTGGSVTVTGANYYPGETVSLDSDGSESAVTAVADKDGAISKSYTLTDLATTKVTATALAPAGTTTVDSNAVTVTAPPADTTAPTGSAALAALKGLAGSTATVNLTGVSDNVSAANAIVPTVTWAPGVTEVLAAGATTASHVYPASGDYAVSVTLKDAANNESAAIPAGTYQVRALNGSFSRTPTSLYATKSVKLTPSLVTNDVNRMTVYWGDGKTTTTTNKTAALTHVYTALGTRNISVKLENTTVGLSVTRSAGSVLVKKDTVKPIVKVAALNSSAKKVKAVSGSITDNIAVKSVTIKLVEKRGTKWYYYNGSSWKKSSKNTKAGALSKAKWITDSSVSSKKFSISVKGMAKGSLVVGYFGTDRTGNKSAVKYYSKTLKK